MASSAPKVGEFRRMGLYGPVYEVIAIEGPDATIRELESQRVTRNYPIEHCLADILEALAKIPTSTS